MSLTIFFISYAIFEPLTNALLKRLTPRIFFTGIILAWGSIMTLMASTLSRTLRMLILADRSYGVLGPGHQLSRSSRCEVHARHC